jgi:hypothetical protein
MNTQQENNNDLMREYFNPGMIEKAPAGFTQKVMTMVSMEAKPVKAREKLRTRYLVPLISISVTLLLTVMVIMQPASSNEILSMPWMKIVKNINLPAVNINLDSLFSFTVPGYLPYLFICILFLTIFDRGLSGLFHRGK